MITNKKRRIEYISKSYKGKENDFGVLKQEFPPSVEWFRQFKVRIDLGFQGFNDLYPCKKLYIPHKRKRVKKGLSNELNEEQKDENKNQAKERIIVEHSIGGMKRYRILCNRNRIKKQEIIDKIVGVCAALWNYSLDS